MNVWIIAIIVIALLLAVLMLGIPIGIGLMFVSFVGIMLTVSNFKILTATFASVAYSSIKSYTFAVIPLFVLMGMLVSESGASLDLYNGINALLKKVPGGVAIATVFANAVFAAITGVSIASAAIFTKIALPQMHRLKYDKKFAAGTIAGSSVLGMLIPPSVLMIVYGTLAEESIGKLFLGGILPGVVLAVMFAAMILIRGKANPKLVGLVKKAEANEKKLNEMLGAADEQTEPTWKLVLRPWPILVLIVVTMGGIWTGFFTPTEAGGVGVVGGLILCMAKRKLTLKTFWHTLLETGKSTGSILFLLISAQMFSKMLGLSGIVGKLGTAVLSIGLPAVGVVVVFAVIHLALGCILDSTSILLLTMPIMVPVIRELGYSMVWYGILAIVTIECGLITPPFGMCAFTVKSSCGDIDGFRDMGVEEVFKGSNWFLMVMLILIVLMIIFPQMVTLLPNTALG